jgi:D-xylose transport system ATP-binding protein
MNTPSPQPVIEVRGVRKRFGAHDALKDVSFHVMPREVVALLGDNGAGKSTMVKSLAGIHRPDSGEIRVDGEVVDLHSPAQARHLGISAVFQDLAMFDNLTVAENFFAGVELRRPRWLGAAAMLKKSEMLERATDILARLEVRVPNINTPAGLLSGGQRQAVAVAKGVAFGKKLVILDEPTAALGLRERENVLRMVKRLPEQGVSVLIISHNLEEVLAVADRCVVLRQGVKAGECQATQDNHEKIVSLIVGARTPTVIDA